MDKRELQIGHIPALLWGPPTGRLFIAVHGDMASKTDPTIAAFAQEAAAARWQVLSFDLPGHGGRTDGVPCKARECVEELGAVLAYARTQADTLGLFACSLGAWCSLVAYADAGLQRALFLSPVVDMRRLIETMMGWFDISPARLKAEGEIATPAKTLYWDYYSYVCAHPVKEWPVPTQVLAGQRDEISEPAVVRAFCDKHTCPLTVMPEGEHWFHTPEQLAYLHNWAAQALKEA